MISEYRQKKAKSIKYRFDVNNNCFVVNDKYYVTAIRGKGLECTCQWYTDNKFKKYGVCSHVLGLLYNFEPDKYEELIRNG